MEEVDGRVAGNQMPRHFFTIFAKDGRSVSHDPPPARLALQFVHAWSGVCILIIKCI